MVRDRTTLARLVGQGQIENVYRLQLMNATEQTHRYRLAVDGIDGIVIADVTEADVAPAQARWITVAVRVPPGSGNALRPGAHPIRFLVSDREGDSPVAIEKSTFVIPS